MIQENIMADFYDGKERQIRILLPDDYRQSGKSYPVLYMFDGQNLFNKEDSTMGVTWGVKEALEQQMIENQAGPLVIIGIDHAEERRVEEYGPFNMETEEWRIDGEGAIFSEFLVKRLIPFLEERFPLRRDAAGRFLAGSSMGGLITSYIAFRYPQQFSKYGVFSLCAWVSREAFFEFLDKEAKPAGQSFYIQVGKKEGLDTQTHMEDAASSRAILEDTLKFAAKLKELGFSKDSIILRTGEEDWHSEVCWSRYMPEFIGWLSDEINAGSDPQRRG